MNFILNSYKLFVIFHAYFQETSSCIAKTVCKNTNIDQDHWKRFKDIVRNEIRVKRSNCNGTLKKEYHGEQILMLYFVKHDFCMSNFMTLCLFLACLGKDGYENMPSVKNMLLLRRDDNGKANQAFVYFCSKLLKCIVGYQKLQLKSGVPICSIASPSDEAFGLLLLENSEELWQEEFLRKIEISTASDTPLPLAKYTASASNGSKRSPSARSTRRNQGWSDEGIKRYNSLLQLVKQDRQVHGEWFLLEYASIVGSDKADKSPKFNVVGTVVADFDLSSDDEDEAGRNDMAV
jgi:hypothetical protein